jgi:predicted dehydrogenase
MNQLDRRKFLATGAAGVGLTVLSSMGAAEQPNDKVRLAIMGLRIRGKHLAGVFSQFDDVEIAVLCDPDEAMVAPTLDLLKAKQRREPRIEKDIRKVLEDRDITAVVVAAPDHWHALATVWACQAGKHVYVEKPVSHNLVEGRRMIEAARKYNRVVQVGTQRRSGEEFRAAVEFIRSGKLGKVPFVRAWIAGNRPSIGKKADEPTPKGVDYDLWTGPAPLRPFNPNRFHYNWHWHWDYGTGELGNNGVHFLDLARWALDADAPLRVTAAGGKLFYDDDQMTPDTQIVTFDFPHSTVIWEHRIWSKTGVEGQPSGVCFYGEKGTLVLEKSGWKLLDGSAEPFKTTGLGSWEKNHARDFLDRIKDGKRPAADIEEGHLTTRLCHLGNIAYRVGRSIRFDAKTELIVDDAEANQLLSREYRKGFELPDKV